MFLSLLPIKEGQGVVWYVYDAGRRLIWRTGIGRAEITKVMEMLGEEYSFRHGIGFVMVLSGDRNPIPNYRLVDKLEDFIKGGLKEE